MIKIKEQFFFIKTLSKGWSASKEINKKNYIKLRYKKFVAKFHLNYFYKYDRYKVF